MPPCAVEVDLDNSKTILHEEEEGMELYTEQERKKKSYVS